MPSWNTVKEYDTHTHYHVYSRGAGGQKLFLDSSDKRKFLTLTERYVAKR